jgi:rhodanese-related sulfurtransferase
MSSEISNVPVEVDIATFVNVHGKELTLVDVREDHEYVAGHVPHAQHIPLGELADRLHQIVGPDPVYLICASGNRSLKAARLLLAVGRSAISVIGGTKAWVRMGQPTEKE